METRTCRKCGEVKDVSLFSKGRGKCKACRARAMGLRYAENPEKARKAARLRYAASPERAIEAARLYRAANPDRVREVRHFYYAANPERRLEARRRWRAANPEKANEKNLLRYCKRFFNKSAILDPPKELIEIKKFHILIQREIRNQTKQTS